MRLSQYTTIPNILNLKDKTQMQATQFNLVTLRADLTLQGKNLVPPTLTRKVGSMHPGNTLPVPAPSFPLTSKHSTQLAKL